LRQKWFQIKTRVPGGIKPFQRRVRKKTKRKVCFGRQRRNREVQKKKKTK